MRNKRSILSRNLLWLLLSIPGILFTASYIMGKSTYDSMMHATGEFGGRFLILTLIASPLIAIFPTSKIAAWFMKNRRYFGVAAFFYTLAHAIAYLFEESIKTIGAELFEISMITGWIAFIIFIPLAITSTNRAVKNMGKNWKKLHRLTYIAAVLTLLHWALIHNNWKAALVQFSPIVILYIILLIKKVLR